MEYQIKVKCDECGKMFTSRANAMPSAKDTNVYFCPNCNEEVTANAPGMKQKDPKVKEKLKEKKEKKDK